MHRRTSVAASLCAVLTTVLLFAAPQEKKWFDYDQVFSGPPMPTERGSSSLQAPLPQIVGWMDDDTYLESRTESKDSQRRVYAVKASDGSERVHQDFPEMQKAIPPGFSLASASGTSPDGKRFVLTKDNDLYCFDSAAKRFYRLTATPGRELNPKFSPDGKWIAYTRNANLFAYDLEGGVEHQYTTDGSDTILNGYASWVYYEEILGRASNYAAFWWAPDSRKIAFMRFDDAPVPVFPIYLADGQHGELERQHYPKAGDPNPLVKMGVVGVEGGAPVWMDFETAADHYIAWPFWTPDSKTLTVQWMNRGQDTIRLFNCDPATGRKTQIFEERQASWVTFFEDLYYLPDGSGFLLRSDVDGWDHLYFRSNDGRLKKRLTSGNWRVTAISRVDGKGGTVYFMARPAGKTWDSQLMRVRLDGSGLETLTRGDGTHTVEVSPTGKYFTDRVSTISTPPELNLCRTDGAVVRKLADSRTARMDDYAWGRAELFTIPSGDGFDLPAYWVLPVGFDPSKRYPVIFNVYGGPDAGTVRNAWGGMPAHYWAQRGVISISVDHRGSGHFGKQGVARMHRNLGKWEMADLITATRWLRAKPFVAEDRIGITGGSYGGYTTLMALTFGAGHFNFGQAASSVTDWRLYDSVYTERYMDSPAENPEGYKNGAVLTWIDRYKGGLRITHGTIDDNVHMQNSIQVIDWLVSNNKRFEMTVYPDSRHGFQASQRPHSTRESHDFWVRNLLGGVMPAAGGK